MFFWVICVCFCYRRSWICLPPPRCLPFPSMEKVPMVPAQLSHRKTTSPSRVPGANPVFLPLSGLLCFRLSSGLTPRGTVGGSLCLWAWLVVCPEGRGGEARKGVLFLAVSVSRGKRDCTVVSAPCPPLRAACEGRGGDLVACRLWSGVLRASHSFAPPPPRAELSGRGLISPWDEQVWTSGQLGDCTSWPCCAHLEVARR